MVIFSTVVDIRGKKKKKERKVLHACPFRRAGNMFKYIPSHSGDQCMWTCTLYFYPHKKMRGTNKLKKLSWQESEERINKVCYLSISQPDCISIDKELFSLFTSLLSFFCLSPEDHQAIQFPTLQLCPCDFWQMDRK